MPTLILVTAVCSLCLAVTSAAACWRAASRCSLPRKRMLEMQNEIGELTCAIDAMAESMKRLRSREGMRELRDARAAARAAPPQPVPVSERETKAQARARIFGPKGGPDFAKRQLELEREAAMQTS